MALGIDTTNLVTEWLPRMEYVLSLASFAKSFQVHRVYVCAIELSTDEAAIADISGQFPSFSVTQAALDWQPDEELDEGEVCSHLLYMGGPPQKARDESLYSRLSTSERHFVSALSPRFAERAGGRSASAFERKSFRLSTLEVYGIECQCPGYHVGATAFDGLLKESDAKNIPSEWWESFLEDEGPQLLGRPARSAVLWQVQVDILDLNTRNFSHPAPKRQRRYGPFLQVWEEPVPELGWDPAAEARQYNGVRYRPERRNFIAETRLPKRRNKVSFGDFKTCKEAARAIDAVFYYYGFGDKFNFADTPKILSAHPKPSAALDNEAKLKFVKEKAKIVASLAVRQPSFASAIAPPVARSPARSSVTVLTGSTGQSPEFLMDAMPGSLGLLEGIPQAFKLQAGYNVKEPWASGHDRERWNGDVEQGPAESRCFEFPDQAESSGDEFQGPASSHSCDFQGAAGSPSEEFQGPCDELQGSSMPFFCVQSPGPDLYQADSPWVGIQHDIEQVLLLQQHLGLDETASGFEQVGQEPRYFQRNSRAHAAGAFSENTVDFSYSRQW